MNELELWCSWYDEQQIVYFPLFGILNGACRCPLGKECGNSSGKHPKNKWGKRTVSKKPTDLDNIGVDTSNLIVIDVDTHNIPITDWPITFASSTSKGYHLWFWASDDPEKRVMTKIRWQPHIDVKAVGGLIVAPPSKHYTGKMYEPLNEESIQPIPLELLDLL